MLNTFAVDSMRVRIPLRNQKGETQVHILDAGLNAVILEVISETGEVINTRTEKKRVKEFMGVNFSCWIERIKTGREQVQTCLLLSVHSKMLLSGYMRGLCLENAPQVYHFIQSMGVVEFSYDTFMEARITDVDIKYDFHAEKEAVESAMEHLSNSFKISKKLNVGCANHGTGEAYTGHSFNERKTATMGNPYMKVYHKRTEALKMHREFFIGHGIDIPHNLWRQEFTLKDKKHMKQYGINNSVLDILMLSQETMGRARVDCMNALFNSVKPKRNIEGIAPREAADILFIALLIERGMTLQQILHEFRLLDIGPANVTKYVQRLNELFQVHIAKTDIGKKSINQQQVFESLGVTFWSELNPDS